MPRKAHYGDVIRVAHTFYYHYGVYVGNGRVIHYTDEGGGDFKGMVQETSLETFLNGEDSYSVREFDPEDYPHINSPEETVRLARSKLGEEDYNFFAHNCEHFAVWCKTGQDRASQVSAFKPNNIADGILSAFEDLLSF
ncbi:MAG: lecithin retinol acyltransferase family protein [Synergistaceae bacterium]|nr:lecithin retinol acyltransferase family protein [Synergistaceae bacterium]